MGISSPDPSDYLKYVHHQLFMDFEQLWDYAQRSKAYFNQRRTLIELRQNELPNDREERRKEIWGAMESHYLDESIATDSYYSHHLQSLFISAFSHFEFRCDQLCREVRIKRALPFSHKDLRGSDLDQIKAYLTKYLDIIWESELESSWNKIKKYQHLRNILVHHQGNASNYKGKDYRTIIGLREGLSYSGEYIHFSNQDFLDEAQLDFMDFFELIIKALVQQESE